MQNARVFLVDDSFMVAKVITEFLARYGHRLVCLAQNLEDALFLINIGQLQSGGVNVAVVDGNFPEKRNGAVIYGGPIVTREIKAVDPSIKVIAFSSHIEESYGDVINEGKRAPSLLDVINSL